MSAPGTLRVLKAAVREALDTRWPYGYLGQHGAFPHGLRLELHPTARYLILRDPDSAVMFAQDAARPELEALAAELGVPEVKLNPELQPDGWRLAVIAEDVLIGGRL